jgi:hypothetical protein
MVILADLVIRKTIIDLETVCKMIDINVIKALWVPLSITRASYLTFFASGTTMRIDHTTRQTAEDLAQLKFVISDKISADERQSICSMLLPDGVDTKTTFETALRLRHPLTSKWFLNSNIFNDWLNREGGLFWVHGIRK